MVEESKPVHVRDIHVECYSPAPDLLEIRGSFRDDRPQGMGTYGGEPEPIHGFNAAMTVSIPDFTIKDVTIEMPTVPQAECRDVAEGFRKLIGDKIVAGFNKRAHQALPRSSTCPHVLTLILAMAPVAVQGAFVRMIEQASQALKDGTLDASAMMEMSFQQWKNSCYVAAEDGPAVARMKERGMMYSLKEVAALIQVEYDELVEMARNNEFPAVEEDGRWVVRWHDLEPWFEKRKSSQ
jgi:hypothetical protein